MVHPLANNPDLNNRNHIAKLHSTMLHNYQPECRLHLDLEIGEISLNPKVVPLDVLNTIFLPVSLLRVVHPSVYQGRYDTKSNRALKADGPYQQGILANPSPQNYRPKGIYTKIGYSMRPKVYNKWMPNFLQDHSPSKTPGPGQYQTQTKKRRISGVAIGKEDRFFMIRPSTPGPGDYHPVEQNSVNLKWGGLRLNSRESRTSFVDSYAKQRQYSPAPGQYEAYSEFDIKQKSPNRSTSLSRQCRRSKTEQIF